MSKFAFVISDKCAHIRIVGMLTRTSEDTVRIGTWDSWARLPWLRTTNVLVDVVMQIVWDVLTGVAISQLLPQVNGVAILIIVYLAITAAMPTVFTVIAVWAMLFFHYSDRDTVNLYYIDFLRMLSFLSRLFTIPLTGWWFPEYLIITLSHVGYLFVASVYVHATRSLCGRTASSHFPSDWGLSWIPYDDQEYAMMLTRAIELGDTPTAKTIVRLKCERSMKKARRSRAQIHDVRPQRFKLRFHRVPCLLIRFPRLDNSVVVL